VLCITHLRLLFSGDLVDQARQWDGHAVAELDHRAVNWGPGRVVSISVSVIAVSLAARGGKHRRGLLA